MSVLPAAQVSQRDRARAISTIVSAFTHDPVERWLFPDLERYQPRFPDFVAAFAGANPDRVIAVW
jgi:hypothetical protein